MVFYLHLKLGIIFEAALVVLEDKFLLIFFEVVVGSIPSSHHAAFFD